MPSYPLSCGLLFKVTPFHVVSFLPLSCGLLFKVASAFAAFGLAS